VGEVADFQGKKAGAVSAFSVDPGTGKLALLNQQSSGGGGPCFVSTDTAGKHAFVANYGGGSVACLPIESDGRLREASAFVQHQGQGPTPRQKQPHAHSIKPDPTGRFVMAADLGLDKLLVYRFDVAGGKLDPHDPPAGVLAPGSGPRHFAFHPGGKFAYVINEMKSTVTTFAYDAGRGALTEVQTVPTLPDGFAGNNSTAEIVVHPSGKFVYGSNRGHDSIAAFSIDGQSGRLTPAGHEPTGGKTPRNFNIDPTGTWLLAANQNSATVVVFKIDPATGKLTPTGTVANIPSPVCVKFLPVPQ
jgi:6-phosphogluconolactonase